MNTNPQDSNPHEPQVPGEPTPDGGIPIHEPDSEWANRNSDAPAITFPRVRAILQVVVFGAFFFVTAVVLSSLFSVLPNLLLISAVTVFLGSLVASALVLRIFSPGETLLSLGFHWNHRAQWNLFGGILMGALFGAAVTSMPVLINKASWHRTETPFDVGALVLFFVLILFGAIGEEVLFRGLVFQRLEETFGPWVSVAVTSVLFAWAHSENLAVTWVAITNTLLWGIVFGVARLRSGDLWLPIGLHAGWNWMLPLLGVELSGFTLEVVGLRLQAEDALWSGGSYGPEAGIFTTLAMPVILLLLWRLRNLRSV